jgi:NTP pyrophosphatase (non-canonical NTP hydrolase)
MGDSRRDGKATIYLLETTLGNTMIFDDDNTIPHNFPETQETVTEWTTQAFPDQLTPEQAYVSLLEETIELGVALGVLDDRILTVVNISLGKSKADFRKPEAVPGEIADVSLSIKFVASMVGVSEQECLDEKMRLNRKRPLQYYHDRIEMKKKLGIR